MAETENMLDYISLENLITEETKAWDGAIQGLPAGEYQVKVKDVEHGISDNKNSYFVYQFEVTEGEMKGRTVKCWYTLTSKAIGRLINFLNAVGTPLDAKKGFQPKRPLGLPLMISVMDDVQPAIENPVTGDKIPGKVFSKVYGERALPAKNGQPAATDAKTKEKGGKSATA